MTRLRTTRKVYARDASGATLLLSNTVEEHEGEPGWPMQGEMDRPDELGRWVTEVWKTEVVGDE